jgi:RNA recognition motif-containing protein
MFAASTAVVVRNIPPGSSVAELTELFAEAGEVREVKIVPDPRVGGKERCAHCEYSSEEVAVRAMAIFHGRLYNGFTLVVVHV